MARLRCLEPFLCEREGPLVIPDGCFVCGAAGGGICLFRSPASRLAAADSPSPLVLTASVADSRSTSSIRLEGCSRRWLLRCSQGLESICRSGGGFLLAPLCAGVSGRGERGRCWRKEEDLVVICLFFRVLVVIWGCTVHLFKYIHPFCKKKKLLIELLDSSCIDCKLLIKLLDLSLPSATSVLAVACTSLQYSINNYISISHVSLLSSSQHHHSRLKTISEFILWATNLIKHILIEIITHNMLSTVCNKMTYHVSFCDSPIVPLISSILFLFF
jgi:hypothetical protein